MNYDFLIFNSLGEFVNATVVYFMIVIFLDYIRTMIFSDR